MKIVHTENSCGWGGQEIRILNEMAGMMARMGNIEMLSNIQNAEAAPLPDDMFAPPAGYKLNPKK